MADASNSRTVKIAYVVSRFPQPSETFIVRELDALVELGGFDVALFSLFPPKSASVHPADARWLSALERPGAAAALGGTLYWLVRRPLRLGSAIGRVVAGTVASPAKLLRSLATVPIAAAHARTVRTRGIEHVHAHFATYPALAAWLCTRLTGVGYSFTAHAHDIFVDHSMLETKVHDARFVVAISEYNRSYLEAFGGGSGTPVEVIHMGVIPERYRFRPRAMPATGPIRAVCVAALQEKKGHALLFDALANGGEELSRVEVNVVGDGPLRGELERRVAAARLGSRVRFHGALGEDRVAELLDGADLFVLPSIVARDGQMEGLPVALMEALACGLPAVTTRMSGIPELVVDGETGYLAKPGDAASLADALQRAIAGAPPLDPAAGRARVEADFDVRGSARELAALFRSAVAAGDEKDPGHGEVARRDVAEAGQ